MMNCIQIQIFQTMGIKRTNYNQFKLMKNNSEVLTIFSNITEMILQSRISQHPKHIHRMQTIKSEIQVARNHQHPSDQLLYFLIDREYYQIKNKLLVKNRKNQSKPLTLYLHFTIFDKESSMNETAQIWKITLNRRQVHSLQTSDCIHEIMNLLRQIIKQLTSSYNFSELLKNKEASKKYIIDFKMDIVCGQQRQIKFDQAYSMWNCKARMNQLFQLDFSCYWKPKMEFFHISPYADMQQRKRNASQETQVDSVTSIKQSNRRKYWSIDQHHQAFQLYDTELDVTIISSDSDSLSNSRHNIQPITVGEVDQFELLIEDALNDDQMFLIENESIFENWQKLISSNFSN